MAFGTAFGSLGGERLGQPAPILRAGRSHGVALTDEKGANAGGGDTLQTLPHSEGRRPRSTLCPSQGAGGRSYPGSAAEKASQAALPSCVPPWLAPTHSPLQGWRDWPILSLGVSQEGQEAEEGAGRGGKAGS